MEDQRRSMLAKALDTVLADAYAMGISFGEVKEIP